MKYTIKDLRKDFPTDDRCLDYIFRTRFPKADGFYRERATKRYVHKADPKSISPMAGTIFQDTTTPLTLWFHAIYLFSISKNGVSAKELQRQLGITYKTAWRMSKQIRSLMVQGDDKLSGTVEIDEAFISRTPVLGAVQRGGKVKTKVAPNMGADGIAAHVLKSVQGGAELMSDKNQAYKWLDRHFTRQSVNHSKEYVRGNVHTNTMENFWSNVKRSIAGTHHFVSPKHLQSYLDFFAFHYEYRTSQVAPFLVLLGRACR